MSKLCFFTDEDVYAAVAPALRQAGLDAVSTPESGRRGESDEAQLVWATQQGRALVTFNVGHFVALHGSWQQQGRLHAGIVVSSQRTVGDLIRRLLHLARTLDGSMMENRLEFLSDW